MKRTFLFFFLIISTIIFSQSSWKKINFKKNLKSIIINEKIKPKKYELFNLNLNLLKSKLLNVKKKKNIITLPNVEGGLSNFIVQETSNFTRPLSKNYNNIKSFNIKGIDDKSSYGKISMGDDGVHITIFSYKHSTLYIDPFTKDRKVMISYKYKDLDAENKNFSCSVKSNLKLSKNKYTKILYDSKLRTYRLALSCTGEYAQFHIRQQGLSSNASDSRKYSAVLSAMNTAITRVNSIYERDLSIKLQIVLNKYGENELIFLYGKTDGFTNNNSYKLVEENQKKCDKIIGNNNYDIGHVLSASNIGLADLSSVCVSDIKGKGATGLSKPINDSFYVDFICHEIGHQFGANHTFNSFCYGKRNYFSAVEPSSGSTIMSYAGICYPNIQLHSDDYFHSISLYQIMETIKNKSCSKITDIKNYPPIVNAGPNVSVPKSTPLVLRGKASDYNTSDNLTYCWEQIDYEISTQPPVASNNKGPMFRSLTPKKTANRYLPNLSTVIKGYLFSKWEVLPSVSREMNFSLVVRDNHFGGGAITRDDKKITVIDTPPFEVTSQKKSNIVWESGSSQTITWNQSTTNMAPINCKAVKIKLSTDGGVTFSHILVENTPNNGRYNFKVPKLETNSARIMVEAIDNIFYNVNSTNFKIKNSGPTFVLKNMSEDVSICKATNKYNFIIDVEKINNFSEDIKFEVIDKPINSIVTISNPIVKSNRKIKITLSNIKNNPIGSYALNIRAVSKSITKKLNIFFKINNSVCKSSNNNIIKVTHERVNFVKINKNNSKDNVFIDLKHLTTDLILISGENYQINVNVRNNSYREIKTYAFIDWNQNCFFDKNEVYNFKKTKGNEIYSNGEKFYLNLSLRVPKNAIKGTTTLRIVSQSVKGKENKVNGCRINFEGKVEDYTIKIKDNFTNTSTLFNDLSIYPIPSKGKLTLKFKTNNKDKVIVRLFNINGKLIKTKKFFRKPNIFFKKIKYKNISSGIYLLQVEYAGKKVNRKIIFK